MDLQYVATETQATSLTESYAPQGPTGLSQWGHVTELTAAMPTSDPSISAPSTQVQWTLWALGRPQPYLLSRVREVFAFAPMRHEGDRGTALGIGVIRTGEEVFVTGSSGHAIQSQRSHNIVNEPPPPSPSLESTPDITASAKVIMYAEMIVKDIFPDQTLAKELACNSLQEVLDSVSASERQRWENDKTASEKVITQLEGLPTTLRKSFKRAARKVIITVYSLVPTSEQTSSGTAIRKFYKNKVTSLLEDFNFMYIPDLPEVFGNRVLLDLALVVLIPDYLDVQLSDEVVDGIFALSGAALFSALKEYETGKLKAVDFSKHLTGSIHAHIVEVIEDAVINDCIHFKNLRIKCLRATGSN
ncbi:hypothetical protein SCLCIDRAFT_19897 [Scleroderma citrinum Foug A]|uniref:DUF6532 domain-containing protein n=1 Tax=Scleroderma citrinum Foug A TaxID=1036808 RepID=A0A0C3EM60_9AGAM|nr:hypothetical protein SCLCIDRAFT_19897 [Scleroderma citrinum Foug A]